MTSCFGLHGGLGNSIFCLPAIKKLAQKGPLSLYVEGDYFMADMFSRCRYATVVAKPPEAVPKAAVYYSGSYAPGAFRGIPFRFCGWPKHTRYYPWPEWEQIKRLATGDRQREDTSDWLNIDSKPAIEYDVGIIPGCKPGPYWERKRYPQMEQVSTKLIEAGYRLAVIGSNDDLNVKVHGDDFRGKTASLLDAVQLLLKCRVLLGTDSGVLQLGASLGIPNVVLYTATCSVKGDPLMAAVKIKPTAYCSPCQSTPKWGTCRNWVCRKLPVDQVFDATVKLLQT